MRVRHLAAFPIPIILGLCLTCAPACQPSEPWTSSNPEFALNAFLSALSVGDLDTARQFLSTDTLALLESNHTAVIDALGPKAVPLDPVAGLYRVFTPSAVDIDHIEVLSRSDQAATLAIHNVFGRSATVSMTRRQGRWIVDLAPPTLSPATGASSP